MACFSPATSIGISANRGGRESSSRVAPASKLNKRSSAAIRFAISSSLASEKSKPAEMKPAAAQPAKAATTPQAGPAVLHIKADQAKADVSSMLYGLMTEEINHSYDGGLFASGDTVYLLTAAGDMGAYSQPLDFRKSTNNGATWSSPIRITLPGQEIRRANIVAQGSDWLRYRTDQPVDTNPIILRSLLDQGFPVVALQEVPRSLEQVYLQAVSVAEGAKTNDN